MTPGQRLVRQRMAALNCGPIHIRPMTANVDWFRLHVARACGRLPEYWRERMKWYFWYTAPMDYQKTTLGQPGSTLYTFRTFREACNKVKEIFSDGGK